MARNVPGSGAVIEPIFNNLYGVRAVKVLDGGSGYDPNDPPRLTITGCGTPDEEALLYPIIDTDSGKIVHVRVLESGRGYDPLRLSIIPTSETPTVDPSFNIQRIWQSNPNSQTNSSFFEVTDRLTVVSDNHPKPADIPGEREPGGGDLDDVNYSHTFIYRGGKDVPDPNIRPFQGNKTLGILSNGTLLHTPEWGTTGGAPTGYSIDTVKYNYIKNQDIFDGVKDGSNYYHQSSRLIQQFAQKNSVFENGFLRPFTWQVKVEFDNLLFEISSVDETLGFIEVGRTIQNINNTGRAEITKVVKNQENAVIRVYVRNVTGIFNVGDSVRGANGFFFTIAQTPRTFPNGIFYLNFGADAAEFGQFAPNTWYFAPENIQVQRNYLIIWDQSDPSNQASEIHPNGHPMQFSKTQDGPLNQTPGTLYYNTEDNPPAPAADYENEFRPLFIMNETETDRIYFYCKYHNHMSGYVGDEGYMVLNPTVPQEPLPNDYYISRFYDNNGTPDYSRHPDGHSKILGVSFDGYPIYGPWGYDSSDNPVRMTTSFRLRNSGEIVATRPKQTTAGTVTYTVTSSNGKYLYDGNQQSFLILDRGKTYVFNLDDASNDINPLLFSNVSDGWHIGSPPVIGDTTYLFENGVSYYIDGSQVTYTEYITNFQNATTREIRFTPRVNAQPLLYIFNYSTSGYGNRTVQEGYILGDLTQDYIYDSGLGGSLDEFNGRFAKTPEYPNGTYAYYMIEDGNGDPVYPYIFGPQLYGKPYFLGEEIPDVPTVFASGAAGNIVLNSNGTIGYVKMSTNGDGYFGNAVAKVFGGEGSGAVLTPIVQTITGLSLLNEGRNYATPPTLIFEGGGGQGAKGGATIDSTGKVTSISVADGGEFYQEPPYILITGGGGIGAKAVARIDQGSVVGIDVIDPGKGYVSTPNVIFTKLVNLKRKTQARQSLNSSEYYFAGLLKSATASDNTIYVSSTDSFPGSGSVMINNEIFTYSSKSRERLTGVTRGTNFRYDQRVILDAGQNNQDGISTYQFSVGDRAIRKIENSNNKIALVYDWNPSNRELLVTFEVDELAFIDAGIPSTEDAIVQFDAGVADSASSNFQPHVLVASVGNSITTLTYPIGSIPDVAFEDDDELDGAGDGIPDLVNTGTAYENQINLDGGIYNSLYGIEETLGGQNTTLFQVGDQIKDASIPFRYATIVEAGALSEGRPQEAYIDIYVDPAFGNGQNYFQDDIVTGSQSGVIATVESWDNQNGIVRVKNIVPYNSGNINIGIGGYFYKFSHNSTVVDFIVQNAGVDYTAAPTITVENIGDIQATATVNMTASGDQVSSTSITTGGYGIEAYVDNSNVYHPIVTVTNDPADTTGSGAVLQAVLGGENLVANSGASYRIKKIEYVTQIRSL